MSESDRQIAFLNQLQVILGANISLVNELADLLDISVDSAYRRMRGETALTFDEIISLCQHFQISFDAFAGSDGSESISFHYQRFDPSEESFKNYLTRLSEDIRYVKSVEVPDKKVIYAGQGIPIFHYLKFPLLSSYKMFYWMKSILNLPKFQYEKFHPDQIDADLIHLGQSIFNDYLDLPSIEIWTDTTVMGTLRQIQFNWDSGVLSDKELTLSICGEVRELLNHVYRMCEHGEKWDDYDQSNHKGTEGQLFFSEIEFENNCILVDLNPAHRVYLGQLNFGFIATENDKYYHDTRNWLDNIISKSNLISGASETIRYQFFRRANRHLEILEKRIREH